MYPDGASNTDRDRVGHRLNYRRNSPTSRTNTGSASQRYYKIGQIVLNGSESAEINIYGTQGYSAGQEVAGKVTIIMRATNGNTLAGFWYEETLGNVNLSDARWKYSSGTTYELWVKAATYANIAPFVRCTGNGFTSFNEDTGSGDPPTSSTAFSTYHRKNIGTINTIRYNSTDTTFHRNIKMDDGYGIDFGATEGSGATTSVLDDYEEGVFTPTLTGGTTANNMHYTKIGRVVHISGSLAFDSISGQSGNMTIGGLPYTSINTLDSYTTLSAHAYDSLNVGNTTYQFQTVRVNSGSTNMMIIIPAGNGNVRTFAQYSHVSGSTFRFRVAGYYITA